MCVELKRRQQRKGKEKNRKRHSLLFLSEQGERLSDQDTWKYNDR
jgi:site-specific recombinase XerD